MYPCVISGPDIGKHQIYLRRFNSLDRRIKTYISFARKIPGFNDLPKEDQISIFKGRKYIGKIVICYDKIRKQVQIKRKTNLESHLLISNLNLAIETKNNLSYENCPLINVCVLLFVCLIFRCGSFSCQDQRVPSLQCSEGPGNPARGTRCEQGNHC